MEIGEEGGNGSNELRYLIFNIFTGNFESLFLLLTFLVLLENGIGVEVDFPFEIDELCIEKFNVLVECGSE